MPENARCGRISYTNVLPVYAAFDAGARSFPGRLVRGVPAQLNRMLLGAELDCSPVSSIYYAAHPDDLRLLPGLCVASQGAVLSVLCISALPLERLAGQGVCVTAESATGRALFDVLCRTRYGFAPRYIADEPDGKTYGHARVLIGDAAVEAAGRAPSEQVYDLGSMWRESTGHPMVYAVWAVRRRFAEEHPATVAQVNAALLDSLHWGIAHLDDEVVPRAQALLPRTAGFYADYYRKLNFSLDETARAGLEAFYELAERCGVLESRPALAFLEEAYERV